MDDIKMKAITNDQSIIPTICTPNNVGVVKNVEHIWI